MKRKAKTHSWHHQHVNDFYVRQASEQGWRSRAAFKLMEIDDKDHLIRPGMTVVDLGCAPGGWCQVVASRMAQRGRVVGIDLLEMTGIGGVTFIQADFSTDEGLAQVEAAMGGEAADLVLSDMAPNITGVAVTDQARSYYLAELALDFARQHLRPDGAFLIKVFQGAGFEDYVKAMRAVFANVTVRKPEASRDRSREVYLLGRGLRGGGVD